MVSTEEILNQFEIASKKFPKLHQPTQVGEVWNITGDIDVIDCDGYTWDTYRVKIILPSTYPNELFELQEIGGKIPKEADWHNSNSCCLSTNAVIFSTLGDDLSLINWLEKFVHPFLANHVLRVKTGHYAAGEFGHGTEGIIQGYEKLFGISGPKVVLQKLKQVCDFSGGRRNEKCFCGSGKKIKNCYLLKPIEHKFKSIPIQVLQKDMQEINQYVLRKRNNIHR